MSTNLKAETQKYQQAKEKLLAEYAELQDDQETLEDTLDGIVDFSEMVAAVWRSIRFDQSLAEGCKTRRDELASREKRIKDRIEVKKRLIMEAMETVERKKVEAPEVTISVKNLAPSLVVTDEGTIPAYFFKPQPPKLDKTDLKNALKDGDTVDGATLSNGGTTVQFRVN